MIRLNPSGTNLSVMLTSSDPVNPGASSWATPVLGLVYLAFVIVALALLVASKRISPPVKVVLAVTVLALPFAGAVASITYSLVRQRSTRKQYVDS